MRKTFGGEIEFPANPFVALADFLIILLLVMILALVHQSLGANKVIERTAVNTLQDRLIEKCWSNDPAKCMSRTLQRAHAQGDIEETYRDGDLQRFSFREPLFFSQKDSTIRTERGRQLLAEFGKVLSSCQGDPIHPRTRPFKRIIVEGHADKSEGSSEQAWRLSLERSNQAVLILSGKSHLSPRLIEASGRGCWSPAKGSLGANPHTSAIMNRRLEIVVVYAGQQSVDYIDHGKSTYRDEADR